MPITPSDYRSKVTFGVPFSGRYVCPEWAFSLPQIAWPMNIRRSFVKINCSRRDPPVTREEARESIVEIALKLRSEYILMLDDDVQPLDPNFVVHLVRALDERPEYAAISGVYPCAGSNEPMVFMQPGMGSYWHWRVGDIFSVAEVGTGCLLIRSKIFESLPKPWFRDLNGVDEMREAGVLTQTDIELDTACGQMTDDIFFSRALAKHGHRMLVHGGVLCIHWGRDGTFAELPRDSYPFRALAKSLDELDPRIREAARIEGWMETDELLWLADMASTHTSIVEIGSWRGRSTRALADNTKGKVLCVDTWSLDHVVDLAEYYNKGKQPDPDWVWDEFRINMVGLESKVHALRMTSSAAFAEIPDALKFDMVFIDGSHEYNDIRHDITAWRSKLTPGGLLCGHDYTHEWPDVIRAVDELVPNVKQVDKTSIWYAYNETT